MTIERHPINGSITISAMHKGYLVSQVYYFYTIREAKAAFRDHLRGIK